MDNVLGGPEPTRLPADHPDVEARAALAAGAEVRTLVPAHPSSSLLWALLAEESLAVEDGGLTEAVAAYAYARTGYHRGLDALRRAGWRGTGPVPVDHEPNQGFLRALLALAEAAHRIDEVAEAERCRAFLVDCGTTADEVEALRGSGR